MSARLDERYYQFVRQGSLAERGLVRARTNIYNEFIRMCRPRSDETIVDVGVSDVIRGGDNMLERRYPYPDRITALGLGKAEEFQSAFPKVNYVQIEPGSRLPFDDKHFDIAVSNAVLEHVGSFEAQRSFVWELMRIGRRVFLTVPNRFFPIEPHTAIPFLHWTNATFSLACRLLGREEWSSPRNLILMSERSLRQICADRLGVKTGKLGLRLGPFSSNIFLLVEP